jgi:hypothetical protein
MVPDEPRLSKTVFKLAEVREFDVVIGGDWFAMRLELFQSESSAHVFRARLWRTEMYRIQPTFPQDTRTGAPAHLPSDELILVDQSYYLGRSYADFEAKSKATALQLVMEDYQAFLARLVMQDGPRAQE